MKFIQKLKDSGFRTKARAEIVIFIKRIINIIIETLKGAKK